MEENLTYDELCTLVGKLYIDNYRITRIAQSNMANSPVQEELQQTRTQVIRLEQEVKTLEVQLRNRQEQPDVLQGVED